MSVFKDRQKNSPVQFADGPTRPPSSDSFEAKVKESWDNGAGLWERGDSPGSTARAWLAPGDPVMVLEGGRSMTRVLSLKGVGWVYTEALEKTG